jgi:hypothetical protein
MSYAAVSTLTVTSPDGGPLFLVSVPVEEILDTVQTRVALAIPSIAQMLLAQADQYAQSSVWPTLRAEVERSTSEAKASAAKLAIGAAAGLVALGLGFYLQGRTQ